MSERMMSEQPHEGWGIAPDVDVAHLLAEHRAAVDEIEVQRDVVDSLRAEVGRLTRERDEWEANEQEQYREVQRLRDVLADVAGDCDYDRLCDLVTISPGVASRLLEFRPSPADPSAPCWCCNDQGVESTTNDSPCSECGRESIYDSEATP